MLIDVSLPIEHGAVFRPGAPPVQICSHECCDRSGGSFKSTVISLPAHTATHIDLISNERPIELERMFGKGKLIDVSKVSGSEIELKDVEGQTEIENIDFVFFRTDWSRFVGTEKYYEHPELSPEVVQWLISKEVKAVGIDALGLGRGQKHGEYDRLLAQNDILVIENLANLAAIPQETFKTYCLPLKIENIDAIPTRVIVQTDAANPRGTRTLLRN